MARGNPGQPDLGDLRTRRGHLLEPGPEGILRDAREALPARRLVLADPEAGQKCCHVVSIIRPAGAELARPA